MKSNIIKYMFIIVVIVLLSISAYTLYGKKEEKPQISKEEKENTSETQIITNIRIPVVNFDTINPIISRNQNIQDISRLIYEPLLNLDKDYKIELCLAKEWSKVSPTSYIVKLKENIKWQDNNKLIAKDIQFTIDRIKELNTNSIYAWNVKEVVSVEVIDELTIRINLDKEVPFFEYNLTFPIISSKYYENEDFLNTSKNITPPGTGKFKVIEENGGIALKQNKDWWNLKNEELKLEQIYINKYDNMGEAYNAFKIGNIDILNTQSVNIEEYIGTLGYRAKEYYGRQLDFIAFNMENQVLSNIEVRQAINSTIDKKNIVSAIYRDKYYVSEFPLDFGSYIHEKGKIFQIHDTDKAKEYLVNNGWEYKSKKWRKVVNYRAQKIELNLVVNSSNERRMQVAENIKLQLEGIGIQINIIKATDIQYQKYLENKNYDMILTGVYTSYSPDLTTYFGKNNLANFNNDEVNSIMQEINNITDEKLLKEKYIRLEEIYTEQIPYIFLYHSKNTLICSPKLIGDIQPNTYNLFFNIDTWYRE